MEPLDTAHEALRALAREIENYASTVTTEQDTRLKVVDRMLTEILGWSLADIQTEERAGTGYVDYRLSLGGRSRLIVEVKRDGRDFDLDDVTPGRAYKLRGPGLRGVNVQEGVEQAIRYCGQKNAELACITDSGLRSSREARMSVKRALNKPARAAGDGNAPSYFI